MAEDGFFGWLRREFIIALAGDDELFQQLTLKGGNALALLYRVGNRTSLDLDYSLSKEVDERELERRVLAALESRLREKGYQVFDSKFLKRPSENPADPRFAGYRIEFKVISSAEWLKHQGQLEKVRRQALHVLPDNQSSQTFSIEISRLEAVPESHEMQVGDGFTVRVYTVELIAAEKLRALCQQMPEYSKRSSSAHRPRDFYDLHAIITEASVNIASPVFWELLQPVFEVKEVPLQMLTKIPEHAAFHGEDWDKVVNMLPAGKPREFAFYAEFVERELQKLYKVRGW